MPALTKARLSMQNLLRPFRGAPVHFCGVLRTPAVFPQHGCSKAVLQMQDNRTGRSQTAATALQGERSRARKGADGKIQADRLGQCEWLRRAVDCAPYLDAAYCAQEGQGRAPGHSFCSGVLRAPSGVPQHWCRGAVPQMWDDKTGRSQTAATAPQVLVSCTPQDAFGVRWQNERRRAPVPL